MITTLESQESSGAAAQDAVRIGAVSYLNTLPLIEGLQKVAGVEVTVAAPSLLGAMLEAGRVDIALAPVIDAQRLTPAPLLVPCGMIGSDGPTMTVRLFSRCPIDSITRVHADTESHTSVALLRVVLRARLGRDVEIVEFDARERVAVGRRDEAGDSEWPEAVLLIGDKVVTDSPAAVRYPHSLDLGEAWRALTGLPFVYAAWMCLPERAASAEVTLARTLLDRQRRHNATRLDWIVARRAGERRWPADLAREYLGNSLHYEVGAREREAVDRFFDLAHEAGALTARRPTQWLDA
jgi:chorismate dehydratase